MATANLTDEVVPGVTVQDLINAMVTAINPQYQISEIEEWLGLEESEAEFVQNTSRSVQRLAKF